MLLHLEAEFAQLSRNRSRVVLWIHQAADVLVASIADHESHAILRKARGAGRGTGESHDQSRAEHAQTREESSRRNLKVRLHDTQTGNPLLRAHFQFVCAINAMR